MASSVMSGLEQGNSPLAAARDLEDEPADDPRREQQARRDHEHALECTPLLRWARGVGPALDAEVDSSSMNETILLVDDELFPRTFARDALQAHGYTVLDTDEPQEALQIIRDQPVH